MQQQINSFGLFFYVKKHRVKAGKVPIYLRITVNGQRAELSLKRWINPSSWDWKKGKIKGATAEVKNLNLYFERLKAKIIDYYQEMLLQNEDISAEILKRKFLGMDKPSKTLLELFSYHNTINTGVLANGTMKNYYTTEEYIRNFLKEKYSREDIFLSELDFQFMTDLEYYIRTQPIKKWDPCNGNGVAKHLERVKKIIRLGRKLKWIKENPFEEYKLTKKKAKRKKLQISEIVKIEKQIFHNPKLSIVQDLFLFACYTGLAYADVSKLSEEDFLTTNDGKLWINTYRQKSNELSPVPILKAAIRIMNKYKNDPFAIQNGTVFPPITNQEVNRNLKIIGEVCGIAKEMNFHLARHTFATVVTLKNGVPIETVSKMLGHTKLSTTQIYAEVDEEKIETDMAGVEKRLNLRKKHLSTEANQDSVVI